MSRNRRKSSFCRNCKLELDNFFNYCPECGQENTDKRLPANLLLKDFLHNYLNLDTRFARSILPMLFKPGFLTKAYSDGQRTRYVDPLRFYVVVSVVFFFVLNIAIAPELDKIQTENIGKGLFDYRAAEDSTTQDSSITKLSLGGNNSISFNMTEMSRLMRKHKNLPPDALSDSLNISKDRFWARLLVKQTQKFMRNDASFFIGDTIKNIPTAFTVFIPIMALLLHLLYIRKRFFYVEHLVALINYQTFVFLLFMFFIPLVVFWGAESLIALFCLLMYVYLAFMLRRVYQDSWFWCLLKAFIFLMCYAVFESFLSVLVLLVSYMLF